MAHHMFGLLVSVPEGRVSCRREHVLGAGIGLNDGFHRLQSALDQDCMGRRFSSQLQAVAAGLLVSFLEGMGSCRLGLALVLCPSSCGGCSLLQGWHGCTRRRIPWRRRRRSVVDQPDVCCVHGSGRRFYCRCVAGLALTALGIRTPVWLSWCPLWFLERLWRRRQVAGSWLRRVPVKYLVLNVRIVSQELAKPCIL